MTTSFGSLTMAANQYVQPRRTLSKLRRHHKRRRWPDNLKHYNQTPEILQNNLRLSNQFEAVLFAHG